MTKLLTFVIPVKDEEATLEALVEKIVFTARHACEGHDIEMIIIDDGSSDGSWNAIETISRRWPGLIEGIRLRRNMGKALALEAGFRAANGDIVFTIDADLQDDPKEIPRFLAKLNEGFDVVSGWKQSRHDPLSKTLPSKLFNRITALLTGLDLHDFNCGFKCYRRDVIENLHLYGELHRYIPVLAADLGYSVTEIPVEHHPRVHGRSKYGFERYVRGFVDLITVLATTRWLMKPGHFFGGVGLALGFIGAASLGYLFLVWLLTDTAVGTRPLLSFGMICLFSALQLFSLGLMAEFYIKADPPDVDRYVAKRIKMEDRLTQDASEEK